MQHPAVAMVAVVGVPHAVHGEEIKAVVLPKPGIPVDADLVFDVRCLPNPHFVPALRRRTGRDRAVVEFMERTESSRAFMNRLEEYIRYVVPYYIAEGKSYLTVAIGCTGGRHRSVMIAERLRKALADVGVARVRVRHRDIRHA